MASKSNHLIKFSAPAKIHIIGEHTAVYGKPTIVSAIDLRLTLTLTPAPPLAPSHEGIPVIQKAIESEIKKLFKNHIPTYSISINSQFPLGSGLGGSAAISATLAAALLSYLKIKHTTNDIYKIAFEGEKATHGFPSGSDLAAVVYGGNIWYRKDLSNLKIIQPLPFKIHPRIANFALINTTKPTETTKEMVENVAKWSKYHQTEFKKILEDQEELTRQMAIVLESGDQKELVRIIRAAHHNLVKLGVVGKRAQQIVAQVEKLGGAAKITGAGGVKSGSGMVIAYIPDKIDSSLGPQSGSAGRGPHGSVSLARINLKPIKLGQKGIK